MTWKLFAMASLLATAAACYAAAREGSPCDGSADCSDDDFVSDDALICTAVTEEPVCLPNVAREPTDCREDDDCADALFPVEAACVEGECRCSAADISCSDLLDPRRCVCVSSSGDLGSFCVVDGDCFGDLNCDDEECSRGDAIGERCSSTQPCGNGLECDALFAVCLVPDGGDCEESSDCVSEFCSVGTCI